MPHLQLGQEDVQEGGVNGIHLEVIEYKGKLTRLLEQLPWGSSRHYTTGFYLHF
jgi:hypothetical protein